MTEERSMRTRAVKLARQGFRVFKLEVFSKIPAIENWPTLATADPDAVSRAWSCPVTGESLDNNIGIATGGGVLVLDVDVKEGKPGEASLDHLVDYMGLDTNTLSVTTPSGGRHLYYNTKIEVKNSAGTLAPGLDIRGYHGFVIAPGSVTERGEYVATDAPIAAAPSWFVDLCGKPRAKSGKAITIAETPEAIERVIAWLQCDAPEAVEGAGGDFTTYKVAARVKDMGVSEQTALELLLDHWNADKAFPPWPLDELERKIANAYSYGQNAIGSASPDAEFDAVELATPRAVQTGKLVFDFVDEAQPQAANPHLIKGWLDAGMCSVLYGASGEGKTFVALDMGWHVGAGRAWNGHDVRQGLVIHLATEGGAGISKRLAALRMKHGTGSHLATVRYPVDLKPGTKDMPLIIDAIRAVEVARQMPCAMLVVDTLSRATAGLDENSASDMNGVMRIVQGLCDALKCHVMLVHHSGKDTAKGARGSSAIKAAVDTELEVGAGKLSATKQRDIDMTASVGFKLRAVEVGKDEQGAPVTSCVVHWLSAAEQEFDLELSPAAKQLFGVLVELGAGADARVPSDEFYEAANDKWEGSKYTPKTRSGRGQAGGLGKSRFRTLCAELLNKGQALKDEQNQWYIKSA